MKKPAGFDDFVVPVNRTVLMSKAQVSLGPQADSASRVGETGGAVTQQSCHPINSWARFLKRCGYSGVTSSTTKYFGGVLSEY
jgi:hypothetical protein